MQEINNYNTRLTKQRKSTTVLVGGLLLGGLTLSIPLFNDSIKFQETLYCNKQSSCKGADIKRGVSYFRGRQASSKQYRDRVLKVIPPQKIA